MGIRMGKRARDEGGDKDGGWNRVRVWVKEGMRIGMVRGECAGGERDVLPKATKHWQPLTDSDPQHYHPNHHRCHFQLLSIADSVQ